MDHFKVWNVNRTIKKIVIADTLESLINKASDKLGISGRHIVLECDGTDIDGDDELLAFQKNTLILLMEDEMWQSATTANRIEPTAQSPAQLDDTTPLLSNSTPSTPTNSLSVTSRTGSVTHTVRLPAGLPPFSDRILQRLRDGRVHEVWRELINESAHYYLAQHPQIGDKSEYKAIGERMIHTFPHVAHDGIEKWTYFTNCLSQRIRHIRWSNGRKSQDPQGTKNSSSLNKKPRFSLTSVDVAVLTSTEYETHVSELAKELAKSKPNKPNETHVRTLLQQTLANRRQWIGTLKPDETDKIFTTYGCLKDCKYLLQEFLWLVKVDNHTPMLDKLKLLYEKFHTFLPAQTTGSETERYLAMFHWIESETGFKRGKGVKTCSFIDVKVDIAVEKLDDHLAAEERSAPRLVLFLNSDGSLEQSVVVGDRVKIFTGAPDIYLSILYFIATYYVADLQYPKAYCNMLGLLQQFVVGQGYSGERSSYFTSFIKKHGQLLSDIM